MSQTLKDLALLKKYEAKLGKEGIAKRVIELCKVAAQMKDRKCVIEILGRFKALAAACDHNHFWSDKIDYGFDKELWQATDLLYKLKKESGK